MTHKTLAFILGLALLAGTATVPIACSVFGSPSREQIEAEEAAIAAAEAAAEAALAADPALRNSKELEALRSTMKGVIDALKLAEGAVSEDELGAAESDVLTKALGGSGIIGLIAVAGLNFLRNRTRKSDLGGIQDRLRRAEEVLARLNAAIGAPSGAPPT